jgi:hypothetical protein
MRPLIDLQSKAQACEIGTSYIVFGYIHINVFAFKMSE